LLRRAPRAETTISGDRDTSDMGCLVSVMAERHKKQDLKPAVIKPAVIYELCREIGAFERLVGSEDDDDLDAGKRSILSRIFTRFDGRLFSCGHTFRIYGKGNKHSRAYYVS